ncbi:YaaC family protein [Virgibacillus sediminis]|uniref:YaaC family protein n=1 Tax=Virgibacillus sediminis TaxID=202260 RepID=A0ABV7A763_9BACI
MDTTRIKSYLTWLKNLQTSQLYLKECYSSLPDPRGEGKSYENSAGFLYYLDQGQLFLEEAERVDDRIKPLLCFYGLTHLMKACLLTTRPDYPESTSILAHGVTSRKRKKKQYTFYDDEVKIQQNGLFSYAFDHLFQLNRLPFEKMKMKTLFGLIPEMNDFLDWDESRKCVEIGDLYSKSLHFSQELLDAYHLTEKSFVHRLEATGLPLHTTGRTKKHLTVKLKMPILHSIGPFYFHLEKEKIYFPCNRDDFIKVPEILIHYLLLYNLSMVSRYETEYWGELFTTKYGEDYSIISHYLSFASRKVLHLCGDYLMLKPEEKLIARRESH